MQKEMLTSLLLRKNNYITCLLLLVFFYGCKLSNKSKNDYKNIALYDLYYIRMPDDCFVIEQNKQNNYMIIKCNDIELSSKVGGIHKDFTSQIFASENINIIKSDTVNNHYIFAFNSSDGFFNLIAYSLEEPNGILVDQRYGIIIESKYDSENEKDFLLNLVDNFNVDSVR